MKIIDYIRTLGYGVLNNTAFGSTGDAANPDNILPLLPLIDEGLSQLYNRFPLRKRHVIIEMQEGVTFYHFKKKYSIQNNDSYLVPSPYIIDLPNDPFDEDVIRVLEVHDTNRKRIPLDDPNDPRSVFMVQSDVLHQPYPIDGEPLFVTYQAKHVPLLIVNSTDDVFDIGTDIAVPAALESALTNYIAYAVYSRMGTAEAMSKATSHLMMFEQICRDVTNMDLVHSSMACTNERFTQNGWC